MKILFDMKKCLKSIFFEILKSLAIKFESNRRHLACKQIKNKIRMQTRRPPSLLQETLRKYSLRPTNSRDD